jgi:hypothetical protein
MLSQDDQRRLSRIEAQISLADPAFAQGLRIGTPHPPAGDRRWPYLAGALIGVVILLVGTVAANPFVMTLGAVGAAAAGVGYQRHVRHVHCGALPVIWWRWR